MYSQKQKLSALEVFHQTNSVSETIRILGYPTRRQFYTWIAAENMVKRERKPLPRFANPPDHPRNPPLDVKLDAIRRCFEHGETIKYVSEDISYSRTSIYQWRKRYLKEGTLGLMNNSGELKEGTTPVEPSDSSSLDGFKAGFSYTAEPVIIIRFCDAVAGTPADNAHANRMALTFFDLGSSLLKVETYSHPRCF